MWIKSGGTFCFTASAILILWVAPKRLPVVLTREEVHAVLSRLTSVYWLMGSLLSGAGLGLMEYVFKLFIPSAPPLPGGEG